MAISTDPFNNSYGAIAPCMSREEYEYMCKKKQHDVEKQMMYNLSRGLHPSHIEKITERVYNNAVATSKQNTTLLLLGV
jgi:hypothetical protein